MNTCETCKWWALQGGSYNECRLIVGLDKRNREEDKAWLNDLGRMWTEPDFGCTLWEGKPVEFEARVELGQIHYDASVYSGAPHIVLPYPKGLEMVRRKVHVTLRYIEEE